MIVSMRRMRLVGWLRVRFEQGENENFLCVCMYHIGRPHEGELIPENDLIGLRG